MRLYLKALLILFLTSIMVLGPGTVQGLFAQEADKASDDEVQTIQKLAKDGFLGDQKDTYVSAKSMTESQVTDALLKINDGLAAVDPKGLKPGDATYPLDDLKALLDLVGDKSDDIVARKASAWKFKKTIQKMIAALTVSSPAVPVPTAIPAPTSTPIPGPSRGEFDEMRGSVRELGKNLADLQANYDRKVEELQKTNEDIQTSHSDLQEQIKLVKRLLDQIQDNLAKTGDRLDQVAQKASAKSITDTELQQELTILHKDVRDNSQDVGILKEEVAKLSKEDSQDGQSPLDKVLGSKWVSGGALLVGVTALIVALTKK